MRNIGLYSFMLGAAMHISQRPLTQRSRRKPSFDRYKNYCNIVIEALATRGICSIEDEFFERLYQELPGKLRGKVLFHCDIENKKIFITYSKFK